MHTQLTVLVKIVLQTIIGRIDEGHFFQERFWWQKDSAGRKLTREWAQELLGRCIHPQKLQV